MRKRFKTHVKDLFSKVNIKRDNVLVYCKNNAVSKTMVNRLLAYYDAQNK